MSIFLNPIDRDSNSVWLTAHSVKNTWQIKLYVHFDGKSVTLKIGVTFKTKLILELIRKCIQMNISMLCHCYMLKALNRFTPNYAITAK